MKMSLTLTGSSAALAAAMQAFESVDSGAGNAASTPTGAGTADAPVSIPSAPNTAATIPTAITPPTPPMPTTSLGDEDEEGDDTGPAGDGSGVDADGLPWDERIHSSNKQKSANGKWMSRRGGPKGDARAAIEAELRGDAGASPAPIPMPVAAATEPIQPAPAPIPMPVATVEPVQPPPLPIPPALPTAAPMPVAAAPEPIAPTPQPAATSEGMDFASFMQQVGPRLGEQPGQIDAGYLSQVCTMYGIGTLTDLALKPELIDRIVAQFGVDGRWS